MKGLSFSTPMMITWLNGTKTLTRRLMNPQPIGHVYQDEVTGLWMRYTEQWDACNFQKVSSQDRPLKPRYLPGETVYIKETWCNINKPGITPEIYYKADANDAEDYDPSEWKWKSPRFMPEWASRSHALIVSVRPERIREITPEEVKKEGLIVQDFAGIGMMALLGLTPETYMEQVAIMEFQALWESLHPGSWDKNDWIWRIGLEKLP